MLLLQMVFHVPFILEVLSTNVTVITSSICFFMCERYLKHSYVNCVENISRTNIAKHLQIKHKHTLVPSQRYQDSRHLLKNPKVPKNVMGFNNHAQRVSGSNLYVDNPLLLKLLNWTVVCCTLLYYHALYYASLTSTLNNENIAL